ncbi:MAG: hypothetical protein K1X88_06730 [Nannocystaceae bacterium]|nr:hypothetical protein [Nannocystaceae bacterium]
MRTSLGLLGWLAALVTTVGCGTADPPRSAAEPAAAPRSPATLGAPDDAAPPATAAPRGGPDCGALSRTACMASPHCTLQHAGTADRRTYRCRPATAPCEIGFAQSGFFGSGDDIPAAKRQQADCNARPGCVYEPGGCYCPCRGDGQTTVPDGPDAPPCRCECGGGTPPVCRAR